MIKGVRRLQEKYATEYKRVFGTMGWRDNDVGNLSAMESGDLGVLEVKIKQIIVEVQDVFFSGLIFRTYASSTT